jgi:4-hydroxyacetophenone monooxygenase
MPSTAPAMPWPDVCDDYNRRNQERLRIFDYWGWTNRPNPDDYELRPTVVSLGQEQR